jgi:hypothetical protein
MFGFITETGAVIEVFLTCLTPTEPKSGNAPLIMKKKTIRKDNN